nr:MAG TPA: hypothetical protein [Caudoviricetes sp.]
MLRKAHFNQTLTLHVLSGTNRYFQVLSGTRF